MSGSIGKEAGCRCSSQLHRPGTEQACRGCGNSALDLRNPCLVRDMPVCCNVALVVSVRPRPCTHQLCVRPPSARLMRMCCPSARVNSGNHQNQHRHRHRHHPLPLPPLLHQRVHDMRGIVLAMDRSEASAVAEKLPSVRMTMPRRDVHRRVYPRTSLNVPLCTGLGRDLWSPRAALYIMTAYHTGTFIDASSLGTPACLHALPIAAPGSVAARRVCTRRNFVLGTLRAPRVA